MEEAGDQALDLQVEEAEVAHHLALEEGEEVLCEGRDYSFSSQWRTTWAFQSLALELVRLPHPRNHHPKLDVLLAVLSVPQADFC